METKDMIRELRTKKGLSQDELDYSWVLNIREQCIRKNVSFEFRQCGTHFIKGSKEYKLQTKDLCSQARKAGIDFIADR